MHVISPDESAQEKYCYITIEWLCIQFIQSCKVVYHLIWWLCRSTTDISKIPRIARFMGPTWAHLGPTGPRWAPCWPHEPCYLGYVTNALLREIISPKDVSFWGMIIWKRLWWDNIVMTMVCMDHWQLSQLPLVDVIEKFMSCAWMTAVNPICVLTTESQDVLLPNRA